MAFSFGNTSNALMGAAGAAAPTAGGLSQGPELEVIQTEGLGFLAVAGDAKVQLTSKWQDPPSPTACLISIASKKGLVAAAGPDAVHIATTESVRKTFDAPKEDGVESEVRPFEPQAKLLLPIRISQLAFTADEQYLIISAETGGGLAVYDVEALSRGSTQPAMEISTSGEPLRALVPNPMPEMAELIIAVTNNGNLLVANLKQRGLVSGPNGPVLRSGVSCAAWSTKGKQLVAGLADGAVEQMTPEGVVKAQIPKPPSLGDHHVASLAWLENHVFLVIHNVTNGDPSSVYHIITRHQEKGVPTTFVFQKLTDPVEPFGSDKKPHHSILRLRDFPPNLQDMLLVSSSSREAIGLLTRSTAPLTGDVPAEKITGVFTTTEFADDSKRAQLPMGEDFNDTFPLGIALDLSSKTKVYKPIPAEEMDESPGPLPGLWALNNEGVLAAWWIVYNESIRQGTTYPGISAIQGSGPAAGTTTTSAFAASAPAFAASPATQAPAFGTPAAATPAPAFGGTTALGAKKSPWASASNTASPAPAFGSTAFGGSSSAATASSTSAFGAPAFGAPAFGTPSALGGAKPTSTPAFGQASALGGAGAMGAQKASPWAAMAAGSTASSSHEFGKPAFGHPSFGSPAAPATGTPGSGFGSGVGASSTSTPTSGGGFSSFANKGGFASLAAGGAAGGGASGGSIFGSAKPSGAFGGGSSQEISMDNDTSFPSAKPSSTTTASPFGSTPFKLNSTFKADATPANDDGKTELAAAGGSLGFGSGFGSSLGDTSKATPAATESNTAKPASIFSGGLAMTATSSGSPAEKPNPFASLSKDNGAFPPVKPNPFASISAGTSFDPSKPLFGSVTQSTGSTFGAPSLFGPSTTPTTSPAPSKFLTSTTTAPTTSGAGLFGGLKPSTSPFASVGTGGGIFGSSATAAKASPSTPPKDVTAPLPPESTSKALFYLTDSSGSSAATTRSPEEQQQLARMLGDESPTKVKGSTTAQEGLTDNDVDHPFPSSESKLPSRLATSPSPEPEGGAVDDAPLPPDPITQKSKYKVDNFQLPLPGVLPKRPEAPTPSLLQQSLPKLPVEDSVLDQPIPSGSEEGELSDEEEGEEEDVSDEVEDDEGSNENENEEDEGAESEGSGIDVAKDLSPTTTTGFGQTPGFTPQSSFGGIGAAGGSGSVFSLASTAGGDQPRRLFGEVSRNAPSFPQPLAMSPRSPSPVRGGAGVPSRMFKPEASRSVSAPGMASQLLGGGGPGSSVFGKPSLAPAQPRSHPAMGPPPAKQQQHQHQQQQPGGGGRLTPDPNVEQQRKAQAKKAADESQLLSDQEDDWKQELLNAPPVPTLELAEFLPNSGEVPQAGRTVPAQAEAMYRDINRMVDTLGLNARHLKEFILGHMGRSCEAPRRRQRQHKTMEDLEIPDDWILCDAEDVPHILGEDELAGDLEGGRVRDLDGMIESCAELGRGLARLRGREMDLRRNYLSRVDPDQASAARSLPLGAEQAAQQADLRRVFTGFAKSLVEAEEALTMLRTRMVAAGGAVSGISIGQGTPTKGGSGGGGGGATNGAGAGVGVGAGAVGAAAGTAPPTVEAVMRTVMKMTSMVEKRSGDVDVLENQIRKLRLQGVHVGGAGTGTGTGSEGGGSNSNSSPSTPQKQSSQHQHQKRLSRSVFSPGQQQQQQQLGMSVGSSGGTPSATPRKKLSGYTDGEKERIRARMKRREGILARVREGLEKNGANVWRMDDDDC